MWSACSTTMTAKLLHKHHERMTMCDDQCDHLDAESDDALRWLWCPAYANVDVIFKRDIVTNATKVFPVCDPLHEHRKHKRTVTIHLLVDFPTVNIFPANGNSQLFTGKFSRWLWFGNVTRRIVPILKLQVTFVCSLAHSNLFEHCCVCVTGVCVRVKSLTTKRIAYVCRTENVVSFGFESFCFGRCFVVFAHWPIITALKYRRDFDRWQPFVYFYWNPWTILSLLPVPLFTLTNWHSSAYSEH